MARRFIEASNKYCRFVATERHLVDLSNLVDAVANHMVVLAGELEVLASRQEGTAAHVRADLDEMRESRVASRMLQRNASHLTQSHSDTSLRGYHGFAEAHRQADAFESAISELENVVASLDKHLNEQQKIAQRTARLIRCLKNADSWDDM